MSGYRDYREQIADLRLACSMMFVGLVFAAAALFAQAGVTRIVPQCQEDQVLLGTGEFTQGRWTSYRCGPAADDYVVLMP